VQSMPLQPLMQLQTDGGGGEGEGGGGGEGEGGSGGEGEGGGDGEGEGGSGGGEAGQEPTNWKLSKRLLPVVVLAPGNAVILR
jgi:hypothetical protein